MNDNSKNTPPSKVVEGYLLAFGELFLKSEGVRRLLQNKLAHHLSHYLRRRPLPFYLHRARDRFFLETAWDAGAESILGNTFGLAWFAPTWLLPNATLEALADFVAARCESWIPDGQTYALRLTRGPTIASPRETILRSVATRIPRKVQLDDPPAEIYLEGRKEGWYVYLQKRKGAGGLPAGGQGRILSLVSGGIDSPVASWLIARRGAENVWLHFHSFPIVSRNSIEIVREAALHFTRYQPRLQVHLVPFSEIQLQIKSAVEPKYRVLLYRRFMMKIAEKIARQHDCHALVTGESLGQVGSQTLSNLEVIEEACKLPVLRPLIGMDKEEIIALARKIGSYPISIKPQEDTCTLFVPKHPTAEGSLKTAKDLMRPLDPPRLIRQALKETEVETF